MIKFEEKQIKHWCWVCNDFANSDNFKIEWVLANLNAAEKEKLDGRCNNCWKEAKKIEKELKDAIEAYEEVNLHKVIEKYRERHNEIEITFLDKCFQIKHKLSVQN